MYCEHCHEEFEDQNSIMITSTLVLHVKRLSKKKPQNHIQYDHQELYCYNHAESTDESGGLSYKSRNKNISEESFSGFK